MIVLASASPRRKELLSLLGLAFVVQTADVDETLPVGITPEAAVAALSRKKARAAAQPEQTVIGADTIVAIDDVILGKPGDAAEASAMLHRLSGREHSVFTGVTVIKNDKIITFTEETKVLFYPLSDAEIVDYIATGEPMDKAGAYGIQGQGCRLVKGIAGDYFNVVGLPVSRLWRVLRELGETE